MSKPLTYITFLILLLFSELQGQNPDWTIFNLRSGSIVISLLAPPEINHIGNDQFEVDVFPNPVLDYLEIRFYQSGEGQLLIYNAIGQIVYETSYFGNNLRINVAEWISGAYMLMFVKSEGAVIRKVAVR